MTVAEYLVDQLIAYGVTDVFGIPGGVVLDFLYTVDSQEGITAHLMYHEQAAAFAAEGFAQAKGTLGCAYATRGPGFTNVITGIADAYQESVPVVFITAHRTASCKSQCRMAADQEMDTVSVVSSMTKRSERVETAKQFVDLVPAVFELALSGRRGPVFLDIAESIWNEELEGSWLKTEADAGLGMEEGKNLKSELPLIYKQINEAQRPLILVGEGARQNKQAILIKQFAEEKNIPVISSRSAQDLLADSGNYFGYIGSHGIRYSNFILSKMDLLLVFGNRLSFPVESASFGPIFEHAKIIWVDVDQNELQREIPNTRKVLCSLSDFFAMFHTDAVKCKDETWLNKCRLLKSQLYAEDTENPVKKIADLMRCVPQNSLFVSDVGNNEFWVSRAYEYAGVSNKILYSRSFGTLGNALPKSIGAHYGSGCPVICFVGDQGLQMNIQELQIAVSNRIPVTVVLLNNKTSGMIKDAESKRGYFLHTTPESGYLAPDFCKIIQAYGGTYFTYEDWMAQKGERDDDRKCRLVEMDVDPNLTLKPQLPKGNACQRLEPLLDEKQYELLDAL